MAISHQSLRRARNISQVTLSTRQLNVDIPCRVMEKLARNDIMEHLINDNLLSKFQNGFIKARSCTTQLLAVLDDWTYVIELVDAIYLDYAKAFDTVPHKRLLAKLPGYGIGGKLLKWSQPYKQTGCYA